MTTESATGKTPRRRPGREQPDTLPTAGASLEAVRAAVRAHEEHRDLLAGPAQPAGPSDLVRAEARGPRAPGRPRSARGRRGRRPRQPAVSAASAETGLPASVLEALVSAGFTVGAAIGRSTDPAAPRRALDAQGNDVVLRVLGLAEGSAGAALLRRLAELRHLRHRALVPVREVVALPGHRVAVSVDLVDGVSLDVVMGARGRLGTSELALLLDELGSALAHLHEHGSVHGDVSTGNVVVTVRGMPVLIDLVGSVMETGTQAYTAPERRAGGPATAAADVYALAALLCQCAGTSGSGARRVEKVLADALSEDPGARPSARDLAARVPELGSTRPVELPDSARLAAGSLRAAARTPTREVASRSRRGRQRRGALGAPGEAGRGRRRERPGKGPGRGPGRRASRRARGTLPRRGTGRVTACLLSAALVGGVVTASLVGPHLAGGGAGVLGTRAGGGAAPAAGSSPGGPAQRSVGAPGGGGGTAPSLSEGQSGAGQTHETYAPGGATSPAGTGAADDLVAVVVSLAAARDNALMAGDAGALAATTVVGSPAAQADARLLEELVEAGEQVVFMRTYVSQITEVTPPAGASSAWPGARAVTVSQSQAPSTRSGAYGQRVVPAQVARQVALVLVPDPWRVAEVYLPQP